MEKSKDFLMNERTEREVLGIVHGIVSLHSFAASTSPAALCADWEENPERRRFLDGLYRDKRLTQYPINLLLAAQIAVVARENFWDYSISRDTEIPEFASSLEKRYQDSIDEVGKDIAINRKIPFKSVSCLVAPVLNLERLGEVATILVGGHKSSHGNPTIDVWNDVFAVRQYKKSCIVYNWPELYKSRDNIVNSLRRTNDYFLDPSGNEDLR